MDSAAKQQDLITMNEEKYQLALNFQIVDEWYEEITKHDEQISYCFVKTKLTIFIAHLPVIPVDSEGFLNTDKTNKELTGIPSLVRFIWGNLQL